MKLSAFSAALWLAVLAHPVFAREPEPPPTNQVRVEIAAPPLSGTVSIGVFDDTGKCLRVLAKNVESAKIPSALNGYLITWDGKADDGNEAPKGDYEIRGVTVGDVKIRGEAYHFNDWIDPDHPTDLPRQTLRVELLADGFRAWQTFANGTRATTFDASGRPAGNVEDSPSLPAPDQAARGSTRVFVKDGNTVFSGPPENPVEIALPEKNQILDIAVGKEGAFWLITKVDESDTTQLREYSLKGEFLRELDPEKGEIFDHVAASENDEKIALLSHGPDGERFRIITQATATSDAVSLWKTILEKRIQPCDEFGIVPATGKVVARGELPPDKSATVSLIENPLFPEKKMTLEWLPASLSEGLWLTTKGGLPILPVASDLAAKRLAIVRGKSNGSLRLYAGIDGAVAEFSVSGLANVMQFTSEKIQWPPGPRQTADESNVPSHEPAPNDE